MSPSNRDDATIDRITRLLEQDEMLAGGVMRLIVGPVDDAGTLLAGDAVDEFDLEVGRAELKLSDAAMKRIIEDAETTVPDILWL
jgi:hypothetical protein